MMGDSVIASAISNSVDVYRVPGEEAGRLRLIRGRSVFGPVDLLALDGDGAWVKVAVPIRPNGTVGWVKRSDVRLLRNPFRAVVELDTNVLTVTRGSTTIARVRVGAGTGGTPTPTGLFFLKELVPQSPGGALGPYAFGISGFSNVLSRFNGGEGVIGIHGTNAPGKLGQDVSHGCIRLDNATITTLAKTLPLGTPVEIVPSAKSVPGSALRRGSAWIDTVVAPLVAPASADANVEVAPVNPDGTASVAATPTPLNATPATNVSALAPTTASVTTVPPAPKTAVSVSVSSAPSTTTQTTRPANDDPFAGVVISTAPPTTIAG